MKDLTHRIDARPASSKSLLERVAVAEVQGLLRIYRPHHNVKFFTKLSNWLISVSSHHCQFPVSVPGFANAQRASTGKLALGKLALQADN
jgi:hypothetical protein